MKHKRVYIVLMHMQQMVDGKAQLMEKCEFVDSLKNRHHTSATVILDYLNEKVLKDRSNEGTYQEFIWHCTKNYPQQMKELADEYKSNTD